MLQVLKDIQGRAPRLSKVRFFSPKVCELKSDLVRSLSQVTLGESTKFKGCRSAFP
jgi:hypothetical protein